MNDNKFILDKPWIWALLGLIVAFILVTAIGCSEEGSKPPVAKSIYHDPGIADIKVIVIDSCEYILNDEYAKSWCTHKGNCKYCEARRTHGTNASIK